MSEGVDLDAVVRETTLLTEETLSDPGTEQINICGQPVTASNEDYQYASLAEHLNGRPTEFRLLTVLPGTGDEAIRCYIDHHPYPEANNNDVIRYEALSWTWGKEDIPERIVILGRKPGETPKTFPIRRNLYQALMQLRLASDRRVLWVDCVCIDQQNNKEKDSQVQCMHLIYQAASNVCVWLGEHRDGSERAFAFMKQTIHKLGLDWNFGKIEHQEDDWQAVAALMNRKWFYRRWILQEFCFARSATLHCGDQSMRWNDVETLITLFERDSARLMGQYQRSAHDGDVFQNVSQLGANRLVHFRSSLFRLNEHGDVVGLMFTLCELVAYLLSYEASEPRDFIYAIWSLAQDIDPTNVPAATTSSVNGNHFIPEMSRQRAPTLNIEYEQKFVVVCKQFLEFTVPQAEGHNLDILLRAWFPQNMLKAEEKENLPSWVPILTGAAFERTEVKYAPGVFKIVRVNSDPLVGQYFRGRHGSSYNACQIPRAHEDEWKFNHDSCEDNSIFLTGFVLDVIGEIKDASQGGNITADWLTLGGWSNGATSDSVIDRLCRTLVADRGPDGTHTLQYYRKAFEQAVKASGGGSINVTNLMVRDRPILNEFLRRIKAVVTNRRMFKGEFDSENLGLAPEKAQTGDYVCIIRGMSVPVVLRPANTENRTHYEMIGECYVHTMMDGRAVIIQQEKLERARQTGEMKGQESQLWTPRWFELH